MDIKTIISHCDHTVLSTTATWDDIRVCCDDGIKYSAASVCIPPYFVEKAKKYVGDRIKVCTVIGFPNGYNTTDVKVFETAKAIEEGADEIDMVINVGALKAKDYDYLLSDIKAVKAACGDHILKVIIETCLLTDEEKIKMCEIVTEAGADYIKTSTGFSTAGATPEDVALMVKHVGPGVKVKAAGGVSNAQDAENFINLGADRIGTSRVIKSVKAAEASAK